jgi:RNA polymerase-binding transcription factor DksA
MDAATNRKQAEKLRRRRDHLAAALKDLKAPHPIEQAPDWVDQAASETSVSVLDHLKERYLAEIGDIDDALDRIQKTRYGFCLACHQAIESHRLETTPETKYCSYCQEIREELQRV